MVHNLNKFYERVKGALHASGMAAGHISCSALSAALLWADTSAENTKSTCESLLAACYSKQAVRQEK